MYCCFVLAVCFELCFGRGLGVFGFRLRWVFTLGLVFLCLDCFEREADYFSVGCFDTWFGLVDLVTFVLECVFGVCYDGFQ